ncbi:MAG: membrane protease subunit [Geminicoccaceae bacterium]
MKTSHWAAAAFGTAFLVLAAMFGLPIYGVWQQGLSGQAALERAKQDRQIAVQEAQAALDSAKLLNQAEVERAKGLAEATKIAVTEFGGPEPYLRYLWIQQVQGANTQLIYVPTEAGIPILEANRLSD